MIEVLVSPWCGDALVKHRQPDLATARALWTSSRSSVHEWSNRSTIDAVRCASTLPGTNARKCTCVARAAPPCGATRCEIALHAPRGAAVAPWSCALALAQEAAP